MKNFYVYYSYEEWGRGYIGQRECRCLPKEDVKYFGSFKDKTFKPTQKIILSTFETREEAIKAEIDLHDFFEVDTNPHFANRAKQTSSKFSYDRTGEKNSQRWFERMSREGHPSKRPEFREKMRQFQLSLGEKHNSKRPEHRQKARELLSGENNPNKSLEARQRCRERMLEPERNAKQRKIASKVMAERIQNNPQSQSEVARMCHREKDELGRSLHAMRSYEKGLAKKSTEERQRTAKILNNTKFVDPEHPELGERSAGTLAMMQKARGFPYGKSNRVKVVIKEEQ